MRCGKTSTGFASIRGWHSAGRKKKAVALLLRGDELEDGDASKREQPSEREPQQQSGQQQAHDNGKDELPQAHAVRCVNERAVRGVLSRLSAFCSRTSA